MKGNVLELVLLHLNLGMEGYFVFAERSDVVKQCWLELEASVGG